MAKIVANQFYFIYIIIHPAYIPCECHFKSRKNSGDGKKKNMNIQKQANQG